MSRRDQRSTGDSRAHTPASAASRPEFDLFDLAGSDPELLRSGRIPDPLPEHTPLFRWLATVLERVEERLRARGGLTLRYLIRAGWAVVMVVSLFLLLGPVINKPLDFDDVIASADVDEVDWVARDATFDYAIERSPEGAFGATVSERYAADFRNGPESTIQRTVVTEFTGHDARFELHGATIDGVDAAVDVDRGPATTTITLSRADGERLTGTHDVALTYELHHLVTSEVDEATGRTVDEWSWPVLAASWPQATSGVEVSFVLPQEVDDALVRAPQAYVGWLLASATVRLTPEPSDGGGVRYSFTNDQNLPPNADIWIDATFAPGTFTQPPTTPWFWVQTYGPLIPLALLAVLLLGALAARRIVWADSAGDPWYVPRSEKPDDLTPEAAARLLRKPRHIELIDALAAAGRPQRSRRRWTRRGRANAAVDAREAHPGHTREPAPGSAGSAERDHWLGAVARAGRRAGRLGNLPSIWKRTSAWAAAGDQILERKLRWAPDSYVRDTFLLAPIALTLLQWALLRQLSHQVILLVVWWPAVFVLVSTVLAIAVVAAVWRPRPLTPTGARLHQQLKGIDAYARATRLMDRGPLDDPLLSYAMLWHSPRRAGTALTELAAAESRNRAIASGWRTERFVTFPAVLALGAAIAILAASIVTVSILNPPYEFGIDHITEHDDLPGTISTAVQGFDISAELARDGSGRARLEVTERLTVRFDDSGSRVPQFAREWPTSRLGQDLGFELDSVKLDGVAAPHAELPQDRTQSLAMVTQFEEALSGVYRVDVTYSLASPIVSAADGPDAMQQLRWTAWYAFWNDTYYTNPRSAYDGTLPVRPIKIQFALSPELAQAALRGGWIDTDHDRADVPEEWGNWYEDWVYESGYVSERNDTYAHIRVGAETVRDDGVQVKTIDADAVTLLPPDQLEGTAATDLPPAEIDTSEIDKYALDLNHDLGVRIDFPADTFAGVDAEGYERYHFAYVWPYVAMIGLGILVFAASVIAFMLAFRRPKASASLSTVALTAIPIAGIAQCVLFFWVVGPMPGDDGRIGAALVTGGFMLLAVGAALVSVGVRSTTDPGVRSVGMAQAT